MKIKNKLEEINEEIIYRIKEKNCQINKKRRMSVKKYNYKKFPDFFFCFKYRVQFTLLQIITTRTKIKSNKPIARFKK